MSKTPRWLDDCEHLNHDPEAIFHGTATHNDQSYDVYTYHDTVEGISCCFRYGDAGADYISPGGLKGCRERAVKLHKNDHYTACLALIPEDRK